MWSATVVYDDPSNFLTNKTQFSDAVQTVISYLNTMVGGLGDITIRVAVSQTATGRFAGTGAVATSRTDNGITYTAPQVAKELAAGANLNGDTADLTIFIDPSSSYFKSLYFGGGAYTAPASIPVNATDGLTVILHELMHGLGITSYRDATTGQYALPYRTAWDTYLTQSGSLTLLDMPSFAAHGLAPIQVTSDSATQNVTHLANNGNHAEGYVDDIMNGLTFYTGHRYFMGQLDLLILEGLGYQVTVPADLPLSYYNLGGKGLTTPALGSGAGAATASNLLHLSGTAAAGAMTSVLEHGVLLGTTTADASGHWSLDVFSDPSLAASALVVRDGTHAIDAGAVAIARDTSVGNHLYAAAQFNTLVGGSHDDLFTLGTHGVSVQGGAGLDTVDYAGARSAATIVRQGDGFVVTGAGGVDTLTGVERLHFGDGMVALDVGAGGIAGQAYRLYQAAFNRAPDQAGVGFWIKNMDHGLSLHDAAAFFLDSAEARALYGEHPDNAQLVNAMYGNVLHRPADAGGLSFWTGQLAAGLAAADMLAAFSESAENQAALVGVIGNGFTYV